MTRFRKLRLAFAAGAAGSMLSVNVWADDLACKPVRDAMLTLTGVKYDARIVTTMPGSKPIVGEVIYTLDATYQLLLGRWVKTTTSPQRQLEGERKLGATFTNCVRVGNEAVNAEPAAVYTAHTENRTLVPFTGTLKLWVSRKRGLPLRTEADSSVLLLGKSHTIKLYSYGNIRPPAGP
jgi:hypothetical protein